MKLLLDTHIWLWSRRDPKLIGKRVWAELENDANELWLSPISTWEALILHRRGKIVLHADPIHWVGQMVLGVLSVRLRIRREINGDVRGFARVPRDNSTASTPQVWRQGPRYAAAVQ